MVLRGRRSLTLALATWPTITLSLFICAAHIGTGGPFLLGPVVRFRPP